MVSYIIVVWFSLAAHISLSVKPHLDNDISAH